MGALVDALEPLFRLFPEVKSPERSPGLKEKLIWTAGVLVIFYVLGQVFPIGVDQSRLVSFQRLEILLGSKIGTLITAGIGPIVLASIFIQLGVGAGLISLDLSTMEGKKKFQGLQKFTSIILCFVEASIYAFSGYVGVSLTAPLFGNIFLAELAVAFQLALGSILLIYLDEVVQKYGIGSGISLFIAAGVSQAVFIGAFSLGTSPTGVFYGLLPKAIQTAVGGDFVNALWYLPPVIFTIVVFLAVVYVEGMRIELPLAYGKARGLGARYPIKFMYVSNMPVILASAVLLNVQLLGLLFAQAHAPIFGTYTNNQPNPIWWSLSYMTSSPPSPLLLFDGNYLAYLQYITQPLELLHIFAYGVFLTILCVLFGWFWIESTGMSAKDVAAQLERVGLQIPGFRADPRVIEGVLQRYIPTITILGSIFVGVLAWFADITGALGTGTGILLTVGILYRFYEDLAKQQLFEMYPGLKNFMA